ncbi:D-alanine--poly(phosphoribitol) ligase subunit DltA [Lacticaseibacillus suibinensis]|uniref:D-alanine--poly(phosphoribitol) ligase subunit DltA n=1 Tax=Lacticaseibacillus suibinensis TaxID=2486011 RepID=UPI000F775758|nr:D-alanine--poly(phosphoribitol) ligase subunit DltA [Lacticaseibacillus suibinensis]
MKTIVQQIDDIALAHPDWPALTVLADHYTYGELKAASDGIAAALLASALPAGPVLVYCDQSFAAIAAFLGVVKAGRAYIPVDTHSPQDRLLMIEAIAEPAVVLATQPVPVALKTPVKTPGQVAEMMTVPLTVTLPTPAADDNFYIIFTSGTTGQPKGVQISHGNLTSFVAWMASFNLPRQPRMLAQAPFSFDLSVMSLYPTLTAGGCLQILPREATENLKQLFETLPQLPVDVWVSTPSFIDICLLDQTFDAVHYPALKQLFFCGEELTHATAAKLRQRFPKAQVFNTYGPTEATVAVTAIEITDQVLADHDRLPIGYAKPDTTITLVPGSEREADNHQSGELELIGPSVSKGYLNRPEKTAAAFTAGAVRGYKTGDLGYITEDGLIFYQGRTDFQIKLNGYRIELEEVDHYLNQAPMIHQAVAVPKYNAEHKVAQLLAYVVPEAPAESGLALTKAIRVYLQGVMMPYMVPQRFIYRDELPLTQNGKVAVKALIAEVNGQ